MAKAPTKREMFVQVAEFLANAGAPAEQVEFIAKQVVLLDKRANAPKGPTKTQLENEVIKRTILTALDTNLTATEVAKAVGVTVQKATALLKQLVEAGLVERTVDGKTALFIAR